MTEEWVRFNEYEDVLASTDLLALVAPSLGEQPSNWKWMIIAAHNGLQGALVCAIKDTSGTNVLKRKSAKERLTWLDNPVGPVIVGNSIRLASEVESGDALG
jgi:hypothetical protein